ncbi:MAG TPA: TetR/AcrR family transcriptional regulator [Ilumatobacteraceae bacterium]|jgi:AcrR family transcriptional regulator
MNLAGEPVIDVGQPVWTRPAPGRRTRFSRDEIAAAAVRIADAEGIEAVSMRRIAAELGAGTMTLYSYVSTKAELFALVTDAVIGENIVPAAELPTDWRAAITAIARRTRAALGRHPWIFDVVDQPAIGPNGIRHFEQSMHAVSGMDADPDTRMDVIAAVDEYVFGYCLRERGALRSKQPAGSALDDLLDYVADTVASGEFPVLTALVAERGMRDLWLRIDAHTNDHARFDRNLARLLDGLSRSTMGDVESR